MILLLFLSFLGVVALVGAEPREHLLLQSLRRHLSPAGGTLVPSESPSDAPRGTPGPESGADLRDRSWFLRSSEPAPEQPVSGDPGSESPPGGWRVRRGCVPG